jgi:hypothetical protein
MGGIYSMSAYSLDTRLPNDGLPDDELELPATIKSPEAVGDVYLLVWKLQV